ncbi:MAG: hypothetical protein O3B13_20615, partial [Planctomycetota bacterium]|nr:hypothetical protein [Planctomycetota bacterium]
LPGRTTRESDGPMSMLKISVVCCDNTPERLSRIVETDLDSTMLDELVLDTVEQQLAAGESRGLHNAAHHAEHGPVTYLQQVHDGGFSILFGEPDNLQEAYFAAGSYVAFIDDEGPGHGSKVGSEGVRRTLRVLTGHIELKG